MDDQSKEQTTMIEQANYFFTGAFILEAIIKIYTLGYRSYIYNPWNKFDFTVVLFSMFDLIFEFANFETI
jgi:hypothetical protein